MNVVTLIGRLTRDPEVKGTADKPVASYTLAVSRGKDQTDFIRCVCFGTQAEFARTYLHKGMKIAVSGRIQTGQYTKDNGETVYTTDVVAGTQEFCEKKDAETNHAETNHPTQAFSVSQTGAVPVEIPRQPEPQAQPAYMAQPAQPVNAYQAYQAQPAQAGFVPAQNVAPMQGMPTYPGEY